MAGALPHDVSWRFCDCVAGSRVVHDAHARIEAFLTRHGQSAAVNNYGTWQSSQTTVKLAPHAIGHCNFHSAVNLAVICDCGMIYTLNTSALAVTPSDASLWLADWLHRQCEIASRSILCSNHAPQLSQVRVSGAYRLGAMVCQKDPRPEACCGTTYRESFLERDIECMEQ